MEQYTNSQIRKHRKLGDQIAISHDNCEQMRKLKILQRSLAERIRKQQRGVQSGQVNENV